MDALDAEHPKDASLYPGRIGFGYAVRVLGYGWRGLFTEEMYRRTDTPMARLARGLAADSEMHAKLAFCKDA